MDKCNNKNLDLRSIFYTLYKFEKLWDTGFTNLRVFDILLKHKYTYAFKLNKHPDYEIYKDYFSNIKDFQFLYKIPDKNYDKNNPVVGYVYNIKDECDKYFCFDVNSFFWQYFVEKEELLNNDAIPAKPLDIIETIKIISIEAEKQNNINLLKLWYPIFIPAIFAYEIDFTNLKDNSNVIEIREIITRNFAYGMLRLPAKDDFQNKFKTFLGDNETDPSIITFLNWWYAPLLEYYETIEKSPSYWNNIAYKTIKKANDIKKYLTLEKKAGLEKLYDDALDAIEKGLTLNSNTPSLWINKGIIYMEKGNLNEALKCFSLAIELDPKNNIIYGYRGKVYQDLGKIDLAKNDYNDALKLNPDNEFANYYLKKI